MERFFRIINEGVEAEYFERVKKIVLRKANEQCGVVEGEGYTITLKKNEDVAEDAYRVTDREGGVLVEASTRLGFISGAGRVLQEGSFDGDGFETKHFSGAYQPKQEFCGMYFASHFGNYYVNAPEDEVIRYVEDFALWGSRFLRVWFDFHHYTGIDDPAAQDFLNRLELILKTGKYFGMRICFVSLANEGYKTTPPEVQAEWTAQNGYHHEPCGHYHTEICPNKEGGLELIIKNRLEMFERFKETPPDLLKFGVYDQGGCTCSKCAPWAANGYIKALKKLVPAVRENYPQCRIAFSAWYLDRFIDGEWDKVYEAFEKDEFLQKEIDYVADINMKCLPNNPTYAEKIKTGYGPGNKPLLGFPEISMQGCTPWGGFGANPYAQRLQNDWDTIGHLQAGMWCYSEGRFEDINKFIVLGLYQGRYANAQEAMRGYVEAELSKTYADDIMDLLNLLEKTLPRTRENWATGKPDEVKFVLEHPEYVAEAAEKAEAINAKLPERIRNSWRWRIVYLRAMADKALVESDFRITDATEKYLLELDKIYYVNEKTYWCVSPVTRHAIRSNMGAQNV